MGAFEIVIALLMNLLLIVAVVLCLRFFRGGRERAFRQTFKRRMAPQLYDRLLRDRDIRDLTAQRKRLSILHSEIQGHGALSQNLPPAEILGVLREYLGVVIQVLFKHGGTLDKVMGDSVMAFFGDPAPQQDHALRAVRAGLEIQIEMSGLQKKWVAEGKAGLQVRIGVSTGEADVGNIGSLGRIEYAVVGPVVDLATRLAGAGTPGSLLIGQETHQAVKDDFLCEEVRGLKLADRTYRLIERSKEPREAERRERRRIGLVTGIKYSFDGKTFTGRTVDASQDGMFIAADELPEIGTFVTVEGEVHDQGQAMPVWILGMVRRRITEGPDKGIGIQFDHIRANNKETIRYFLRNVFGIHALNSASISSDDEQTDAKFRYEFSKPEQE